MTGLILPGIIDDPGWSAGSTISAKARLGSAVHQPQVVGDLHQANRVGFQLPAQLDRGVHSSLRRKVIGGFHKRQPGRSRQTIGHVGSEVGMRIEAGAYCCTAYRQLRQSRQRGVDPASRVADLRGPPADFLAQAHRRRIHQVGAPGFHDIARFLHAAVERLLEVFHGRQQLLRDEQVGRHMNRRGNDVIAALAHVDIVIRMNGPTTAGDLGGAGGNDLISIHVGRRA